MSAEQQRREHSGIGRLLEAYRPPAGVCDELLDGSGRVRAHWLPFLSAIAQLAEADADELPRRFNAADRYLREAGVFHRVYDSTAGSPEFLRPMVGVKPRGGHHLWFYAADLGRGPDGRWWVLGDRTQAPSGAGYALENRVAMGRALSDVSRQLNVHRLAGFFLAYQQALTAHRAVDAARVGLLSPGPLNETYFEHAYLARYLGFLLVEGEDLTVRRDRLYVRTVTGLKPIDVLWRRLDSVFADPLELNGESRIGVPGLARAVRAGNVMMANALNYVCRVPAPGAAGVLGLGGVALLRRRR